MKSTKWIENIYEYDKKEYFYGTRYEIAERVGTTVQNVSNICRKIGYKHRLIKLVNTETLEEIEGTLDDLGDKMQMTKHAILKAYGKTGTLQRGKWKMIPLDEMVAEFFEEPKYYLEDDGMIQMRSFNDKHKHAPTTIKENREAIQVLKTKSVKPAKWQASPYTRQLFYQCFKGWG